jgi:hypothetical protein
LPFPVGDAEVLSYSVHIIALAGGLEYLTHSCQQAMRFSVKSAKHAGHNGESTLTA